MTREEEIRQFALERNSEGDFDSNDGYQGIIEGAQWADEHPRNSWISVEERLPDDNKTVLVWFGGHYTVAVLRDNEWWECTGYQTGGGWSALDKIPDIIASNYITHWMYIPKAPTL